MKTTESIPCLQNTRDHALKHAESLAQHIRDLEDEIRATEAKLKVANYSYELAQAELDIALEEDEDPDVNGHHAGDIGGD